MGKSLNALCLSMLLIFFREYSIDQSGFLPGMSTVTQLIEVYHSFCKAVDEGKEIPIMFLDISIRSGIRA